MQEMNSPQFNIKLNSKLSSSGSVNETIKQNKSHQINSNNISNDENSDPNTKTNDSQLIFHKYQTLVNALKSNEYTIDILSSNINHLEKQFTKKDQLYLSKLKQIEKLKKTNSKTMEAIKAEKHRTKKLEKSSNSNLQQLQEIEAQLKQTFEQRLRSQQHKNQIYLQYKDLEQEYSQKIQQLQNFFTTKTLQSKALDQEQTKNHEITSVNESSLRLRRKQIFQKLRQENDSKLPTLIEKNQKKIEQLQYKLESHLENRQKIKMNIHKITQSIKSLEHEQYQHQVNIEKLQKQKYIFSKNEHQVNQKNQYLNQLFAQVQQLRNQLDQKCEQKYGLVKYLKQVEKEEKNLRKLRKIQVECSKEQELYKQERNQKFAVVESEQDQRSPQNMSKQRGKSSKVKPSQSAEFKIKNEGDNQEEVQRFDTQTRERLSHIIHKYQNMKSRRRN